MNNSERIKARECETDRAITLLEFAAARKTVPKLQGKNRALLQSAVEKLAAAIAKHSISPTFNTQEQEEVETMSNAETIKALAGARDATLRASLAVLVNGAGSHVEDLIQILGEVIDDHAVAYALRTGDYDYAGKLSLMAKHLEGLESFIDNYDPSPAE